MDALLEQLPFERHSIRECTIEANPQDIHPDVLDRWHRWGISRVSLGCQSFQDDTLQRLGRNHDGALAKNAVSLILNDGRFELSIDLIYGSPGQTLPMWQRDLDQVASWPTLNHVSAYQLTIEPRTPFATQHERGQLHIASEQLQVELLDALRECLASLNIEQYEVSSFARAGHHALHNSGYWLGVPYLGLGVGAHSLIYRDGQPVRRANTRQIKAYLTTQSFDEERIDPWTHLFERLFVNVRTTLGVDLEAIERQFAGVMFDALWEKLRSGFDLWVEQGLMRCDDTLVYRPTHKGLLMGDWMASRLDLWLADCQGS